MSKKPFYAIILPVIWAGIGDLVDVADENDTPDGYGIFVFSQSRKAVTVSPKTCKTYQQALKDAPTFAQHLVTAFRVSPEFTHDAQGRIPNVRNAKFWTVQAVTDGGEEFWFADCWNKESAINLACAYGQTIITDNKVRRKQPVAAVSEAA